MSGNLRYREKRRVAVGVAWFSHNISDQPGSSTEELHDIRLCDVIVDCYDGHESFR